MALPLVVKGLLDGICMLGITSCGKLSAAPCSVCLSSASSSPPEVTAWLADSSMVDSSSESFSEWSETALGVLGTADTGVGESPSKVGGMGSVELAWPESFLLSFRFGDDRRLSDSLPEPTEELYDADLVALCSLCPTASCT